MLFGRRAVHASRRNDPRANPNAWHGGVLQRRLQNEGKHEAAQHSKRARQAAEGWRPADVVGVMAPALAAGSPEAPELLAKLVLVAPSGDGGNGDRPLVGDWLRAKLASPDDDARQGERAIGLMPVVSGTGACV